MAHSLYVSTTEVASGKALVSLGVIECLSRKTSNIGFFRPIIRKPEAGDIDDDIKLILTHFRLKQSPEDAFGLYLQEATDLLSHHHLDDLLDRIIERYKQLEKKYDFVVCEGSDFKGQEAAFEFDLNVEIVKNLGCPVLIVGKASDRTPEEAINSVQLPLDVYREKECDVVGVILNLAQPDRVDTLKASLVKELDLPESLVSVIPYDRRLSSPRMRDVVEQLNAEVLYGHKRLNNLANKYVVAAMQVQHALERLKEGNLAITPGDRSDVILGVVQADQSVNYPNLAGLVLSCGIKPHRVIAKLLDGLPDPPPILCVKSDTYTTASAIHDLHISLTCGDREKIHVAIETFDRYVNLQELEERIEGIKIKGMTPKMFTYNLVQQAKAQKRHIVLPEGNDPRILQATSVLLSQGLVNITLLGSLSSLEQTLKKHNIRLDLNQVQIINPAISENFDRYAETLYECRKHKNLSLDMAKDLIMDVSYFGTLMVYSGDADGMVSGAVHTTQHTIRPALQIIKTQPECSIVSSVFLMCLEDRVLVYGDCAVNPNPTAEQLAEIALSSADTAKRFGIEPRVALLSYSSGESGKGEEVEKVRKATHLAQQKRPDLKIEGPIQYDAAVEPDVGAQKIPDSEVAGQATVLVFPDLNTGNNTYKAVQRETGAIAIGPVLQGLRKPVNDLSRGCTVTDIINTVTITAIQTQTICPLNSPSL